MFEKFNGKIIWSADGISLEELLTFIDKGDFPKEEVAIKLDRLILLKYGLLAISEVQKRGVPVFADAKIVEIPSKVDEIVKLHLEYQPWMLNIMAGACSTGISLKDDPKVDELYRFANLCKDAGTKSCVVTVLTSKTGDLAKQEFGKSIIEAVVFYSKLAIDCGITDIVCSSNETAIVRTLGNIDINNPGIRLPGSDKDDQFSVGTPFYALKKQGANRIIVGRDLSRDGKFTENLAKIMANIEGGQV